MAFEPGRLRSTLLGAALAFLALPAAAFQDGLPWTAREAEHLLNRAGFGADHADVQAAVLLGREALIEALLEGLPTEPFFYEPPAWPTREQMKELDEDAKRRARQAYNAAGRTLQQDFASWWLDQMVASDHPLRERMTLFWHGHFTSSFRDVRDATAIVEQNELLRRHALGNFGELLRAIVRDPAMVEFLDNNKNKKQKPNENLARELMELFTLGEGNYTERDVKQAARALTGWVRRRGEDARFLRNQHDKGKKTILGETDAFDLDGLVDLLLAQEACPRWIAGKLLAYFEGRPPAEERLQSYADLLRAADYELAPFLRELFSDPAFYADEVVGTRIASPVDYLVGSTRRLGARPPGRVLWLAACQIGECLMDPPNVKGWEGGRAWITTSTFLQRGNFAGMLLGVVDLEDVLAEDPALDPGSSTMDPSMDPVPGVMDGDAMTDAPRGNQPGPGAARKGAKKPKLSPEMAQMKRALSGGYRPGIHLSARCQRFGAERDAEVVEFLCAELLAVDVSPEGRATLLDFLARERSALDAPDGELFVRERAVEAEKVLRRLAHLVLSLPEAQLM